MIIKTYKASDVQCDEGKKEVVSIINTTSIDRDGEIVVPKGIKRRDFNNNPVVFANHNYMDDPSALPIGVCKWIKSATDDNGNDVLIAKTRFSEATQEAKDVWALVKDGILNSFSIGFMPIRQSKPTTAEINANPELKKCKNMVRESNLLEYSIVSLPANPDCRSLVMSKGYSRRITDMLFAKQTDEVVKEIVKETVVEKGMYEFELKNLIAKRIDRLAANLNADAILSKALAELSK